MTDFQALDTELGLQIVGLLKEQGPWLLIYNAVGDDPPVRALASPASTEEIIRLLEATVAALRRCRVEERTVRVS